MEGNQQYTDDEIDLRELFDILWAEKKLIVCITAVAAVVSVIIALWLTDIYRAHTVLISAEEQQPANGLASQYGGAAALLGVDIGAGGGGNLNTPIAVMNSREFIGRFIDEHELLVPLFAGTWDGANETAGIDADVYDATNDRWLLKLGKPTRLEAYREFSEILSISDPDTDTGIVTLSIDLHNPYLASQWVNQFVFDINAVIRQRDVAEATSAISYLESQLGTTQLVEMQRIFYQLIESQTRIIMLADVRDEYVFRTIDPAVVPDRDDRVAPKRALICILGTMAGGMFSVLFVFGRRMFRPESLS